MTRRQARENAFIAIFASSFGQSPQEAMEQIGLEDSEWAVDAFGENLVKLYQGNADAVDAKIESLLKGWNVKRLQRVNLAVLRSSVAEMLFGSEDLDSVIINEAVEISKKFGDEKDYQFVNGLLGSVAREKEGQTAPPESGA